MSPEKQIRLSDDSVLKATGQTWTQWRKLLDAQKANKLTHPEIVKLLREKFKLSNSWWQQMVTNTYEKLIGRRVMGSSTSTGFMMGAQATFPMGAKAGWNFLVSPKALKVWLGTQVRVAEGSSFKAKGASGEFRTVKPGSHLRLTRKPSKWEKSAALQVRVNPKGRQSALSFHMENLPGVRKRLLMKKHWAKVLEQLTKIVTTYVKK